VSGPAYILRFVLINAVLVMGSLRAEAQQPTELSGYEIAGHAARIEISPLSQQIVCTDTLTLHRIGDSKREAFVRLVAIYEIHSVQHRGRSVQYVRTRDGLRFSELPADSVLPLVISYSGRIPIRSESSSITGERAILREEELLPYGSRKLRSVRLSVTVPSDWVVVAPGDLVQEEVLGESKLFVFQSNEPLLLIGWIVAGKYWTATRSLSGGSIVLHLFPEDSARAPALLDVAEKSLAFYSSEFAPYRFRTLRIVEAEQWLVGPNVMAVAIPSAVIVKKLGFETEDQYLKIETLLPHEIAHQWWPMTVFLRDEDAVFLGEGMSEYSALLFTEAAGALSVRDTLSRHPFLRPLIVRVQMGNDVPLGQKADLRAIPTQYLKASYVFNMLRLVIGDSVFRSLYREFAHRFRFRYASMEDFIQLAEERSGQRLGWFFDQWVNKKGIPQLKLYNVKSMLVGERWMTRGRVRILGYEKYTTPVDVGAIAGTETIRTRVWLGVDSGGTYRNDVPFEISSGAKPSRVMLDPDGAILKIQKLPVRLGDLREPADGIMIIGTRGNVGHLRTLARKDSATLSMMRWSIIIKPDTAITLVDLQTERVLLYGRPDENRIAAQLQDKFAHTITGKSVIVNGETLVDSTLTLVQLIENPYLSQALICWIAPLSSAAKPELTPSEVSWMLIRDKDVISWGEWQVIDDDLVVDVR
jgi:hypothetical protein